MNRNLSKRPKVVRRLDGALTAWRYFHGLNFSHTTKFRRRVWTCAKDRLEDERAALFTVLVRFVEWMQAPISPWAGSPFVDFVDATGTRRELRRPIVANAPPSPPDNRTVAEVLADLGATVKKGRSDIARVMSKGRPGSPFYTDEI